MPRCTASMRIAALTSGVRAARAASTAARAGDDNRSGPRVTQPGSWELGPAHDAVLAREEVLHGSGELGHEARLVILGLTGVRGPPAVDDRRVQSVSSGTKR